MSNGSRFFSVMVVGENHRETMDKYSLSKKTEPYVKYEYLKAESYLKVATRAVEKALSVMEMSDNERSLTGMLSNRLVTLRSMTPFDYYRELTEGMYYDNNGNALSTENKDGRWRTANIGRNFSVPLRLKDGTETYTAKAGDVDWDAMCDDPALYRAAWELVVDGRDPVNDEERVVKEAMDGKTTYFSKFKGKDDYVAFSTSLWYYAYVDKNGWTDIDSEKDDATWVATFRERFIDTLDPNETVTIYECSVIE